MKSMSTRLTDLDLANNQLGPLAAESIAAALPHCPALKKLVMAWNSLAGGAQHIAWSLVRIALEGRQESAASRQGGSASSVPHHHVGHETKSARK